MVSLDLMISDRRASAFTIFELLVVVGALVVLAGFLFAADVPDVPHLGLAIGIWLLLTCALPALARRPLLAYFLGFVATAGLVSYCMYYRGFEFDGGWLALVGGFCTIPVFSLFKWMRRRKSAPSPPNPPLQRTPGSGSVSKPDASGPAPLS